VPGWPDFDHWFPPIERPERRPPPAYALRHPTEDEHGRLLDLVAGWFEQPTLRPVLPRLLLRQLARVSWLGETADGRTIGLLLGLVGPDRPEEVAIVLVGVDPEMRRRGIGRALVERLLADAGARGARRVVAAVRPDDLPALAFFAALGFDLDSGPGSVRIHGVPAFADWDGPREDRALLVRSTSGG